MSNAAAVPNSIVQVPVLVPLGEADAASCDGDFCAIPDHHTQAVINRRLDDDAV